MMNKLLTLATLVLFSISPLVSADPGKSSQQDWSQIARQAELAQLPLLVLFTADECAYCERLKQEVLKPLLRQEKPHRLAVFREVDINTGGKMIDFNGESIRSRLFKDRYQVFATPTLLILNAHGDPLANPIVGYNSQDEYLNLLKSHFERLQRTGKGKGKTNQAISQAHRFPGF